MKNIMHPSVIRTLFSNSAARRLKFGALGSLLGLAMLAPTTALGWDYSNVPLFWTQSIKPNVALMIDDSGSMKAMTTNEAFRRANVTSTLPTTDWYWCTNYDNGANKRCTSTYGAVDSGFHVLAWEPPAGSEPFTVTKEWEPVSTSGGSSYARGCESNDTGFFNTSGSTSLSSTITARGICKPNHGYNEGDLVKYISITGAGSTTLSTSTDYYIVSSENNGFRLATSPGGSPISFSVNMGNSTAGGFNFTVAHGLPQYISGKTVSLCNVTKAPGAANFYIGNSGSAPAVTVANLPTANQVGVLVSNRSGGGGTMDSCVRWKMSSTARSANTTVPEGWDYKRYNTGTNYKMDSNIPYGNFLLNTLIGSKSSFNFDNNAIYPDRDTVSTTRDWDTSKDRTVSSGGTAADNKYFIIPSAARVEAAREAAQKVVLDFYDKLNIGLFHLNRSPRLRYAIPDGSDPDGMKLSLIGATESMLPADLPASAIDGHIGNAGASGGTPLASTQTTINNYFSGASSPIQYRCQKNYAVVMTDGESSDSGFDTNTQTGYDTDAKKSGNDADGIAYGDEGSNRPDQVTGQWTHQNIIPYTIGLGLENNLLKRAPLVNRVNVTKSEIANDTIKLEKHGLETGDYVEVVSNAATGLKNGSFYYAVVVDSDHFKLASNHRDGQSSSASANLKQKAFDCAATGTTNGNSGPCLPVSNGGTGTDMVMSTGPGKAFFSFTPDQLAQDLSSVFNKINNLTASASAVSTNTKQFGGADTALVYQARFNTEDWSGEVAAYQINVDGNGKATVDTSETATPYWTTKTTLKTAAQRTPNVFTWKPSTSTGQPLAWGNLDVAQQATLVDAATGDKVINWLKGTDVPGMRAHSSKFGLLGDILNSDPAYFSYQNFGYTKLPTSGPDSGASSYAQYVEDGKSRTPMIFVGANDGMLHGLDANTGVETMAFLPSAVFSDFDDANDNGLDDQPATRENKLLNLTDVNYSHRYFVDGSSAIWDAYNGSSWGSYLVGALGKGGRSVYAIDVTDTSYTASDIQWEFTHQQLGYTYGKPIVARLANNKWYAIFPNGLDSQNDQARVFMVNIHNAADFVVLQTNTGSPAVPNGMMSVQVKINTQRTVTDIYAGDMRGNIWKFDMYDEGAGTAQFPGLGTKLFTAGAATTGTPQAITGGISVGKHPDGLGSMIFFGTGKYFETQDSSFNGASVPQVDSFYGVLDDGTTTNITRAQLQAQSFAMDGENRTSSTNTVAYAGSEKGWYIDLLDGTTKRGERVISQPVLYGDRIIFVSIVPLTGASCGGEGSSYLNELSALSGGMLPNPVVDTNNDGRIDGNDSQVSSLKLNGLSSDPSIIRGSDRDYKVIGNTQTSSSISITSETQPAGGGGGGEWGKGRLSWQQLQ
ncbi:MAG: PilC/PilY family type IV pilus protein [Pseudomonadales bacterium]